MISLTAQGEQQLKLGLWSIALATFEQLILLDETDESAWDGKVTALKKLMRWDEAVEVEERLVRVRSRAIFPDRPIAEPLSKELVEIVNGEDIAEQWFESSIQKCLQSDFLGALQDVEKAIEIKPDHHKAWNYRGISLYELGRYVEAIESYEKAIEIKPDYHTAWLNLGSSLDNLGRSEEAIESYEKAIKIKPDDHEAWFERGHFLSELGRYVEALASFDKAIEIKPNFHEAWYNRGCNLSGLGRKEEAIESYEKAKAIQFEPK